MNWRQSIWRVIIVKRNIAAALSSSTVCLCPSAVCRVHNYMHTHTYTLETGYVLHKLLFLQSSSSTGVAMTTNHLSFRSSARAHGEEPSYHRETLQNHQTLSYQHHSIRMVFCSKKYSQHIKIQHILAIWPFSLHPLTLPHAKRRHTAGLLLM